MTRLARCTVWCLAVVLAAATAACTSSGDKSGNNSSPSFGTPQTRSASAPPSGAAPGSTGSAGSAGSTATAATGSGRPADPSTKKLISDAYAAFFDSTSTTARSEAALQHGRSFVQALQEQSNGPYSDKSSVKVGAVSVAGNRAYVTFTILSNGKPLLNNFKGYAAREGGRWKVAAITFCTLLQLQGGAPVACNDPTITALPQ